MQYNPYVIAVFISALLSAITSVYTWRRRESPGASYLTLLLVSTTIWSFAYAMELSSSEKHNMCFWLKIEYLGISFMSLWCLLFAFQYTDYGRWFSHKVFFLSIIPVLTLFLNWTNDWHGLFYSKVDVAIIYGRPVLVLTKGIWYWVHIVNFYISLLLMLFFLLRMCWQRGALYRKQALSIVIGALLPCIGNILYLTNLSPFPNLDLSPFTFVFMGIVMLFGLFRYRLFNVVPIARDALIECMGDGVIVVDKSNCIVDINPSAQKLTGLELSLTIGQNIDELLSFWPEFLSCFQNNEECEITGKSSRYLDIRIINLTDDKGKQRGKLIILRDVTSRKELEIERENLILSLRDALSKVKTLNGLLPICANCKKIRDDKGYWHQVEIYICEHSDVNFSHGVCPDCFQKLYPDFCKNKYRDK